MASVFFNSTYIRNISGILKVTCMILLLLGFVLVVLNRSWMHSNPCIFFNFVVGLEFICTLTIYLLHLFNITLICITIPWSKIEFNFAAIFSIFLAFASILLAIHISHGEGLLIAAACIGFLTVLVYGYDAVLKYRQYKSGPLRTIQNMQQYASVIA